MAAGSTYSQIASFTLTGTSSQITFSSIPSSYTDLRLVSSIQDSGETSYVRFNTSTGNYSRTLVYGYGSVASTTNGFGLSSIPYGGALNNFNGNYLDILNYANTNVYKTVMFEQNEHGSFVANHICLWESTAAINRIDIYATSANSLKAGSTFSLYGIAAA